MRFPTCSGAWTTSYRIRSRPHMATSTGIQKTESERFVHDYLGSDGMEWPHLGRKGGERAARWQLLVRGNLTLDLPIGVSASLADFVAALNEGHEKFRCEWQTDATPLIGGYVGQVAPLAAGLGFAVHLNC